MKNNIFILEIFKNGDNLEKELLRNHLLAVLILIAMVFSGYIIITNIISTQKDGAKLINKSGKQRMYTQRVLTYYYQKDNLSDLKVQETLNLLKQNNQYLIQKLYKKGSISYNSKFIRNIFYKKGGIIETLKSCSSDILIEDSINHNCQKLFELYEKTTLHYESIVKDKIESLRTYETIILIISIITIILEALLIFRPAIIEVYVKHNELKLINKSLDQKVQEQLEELKKQEQILIQQSKMAEMGEMLSDISHQWKQPLTILSLQIDTIQNDIEENRIDKKQLRSDFSECFKTIDHMHKTIEDFKNFYRPDYDKKLFNVVYAINEVITMEKTSLCKNNIDLTFNYTHKDITLLGFEGQFKQVIMNLINNAIEQFLNTNQNKNRGKIHIDLSTMKEKVMIKVYDNAGGVSNDIIDKVFNPYFTTKENNGGTGIGLYMIKTIIEKNFLGKVSLKNLNDGVCFKIVV